MKHTEQVQIGMLLPGKTESSETSQEQPVSNALPERRSPRVI